MSDDAREVRHRTDGGGVDEDLTQIVGVGGGCSYVLVALLFLILLYPELIDSAWGRILAAGLVSSIIIAIIYAVGRSRRLPVHCDAARLAVRLVRNEATSRVQVGVAVFLSFLGFAIAQLLPISCAVTGDKLHAALAIYILILGGFLWAGLYTLLSHLRPGSFLVNTARGSTLDFYDMLYFSFTTLTTAGYGDLTPATRRAELLMILEQVSGVSYVAVLIARLAGLYPPGNDRPT